VQALTHDATILSSFGINLCSMTLI